MRFGLGFRIFCKNILLNLIIILQLFLCLLASNGFLGIYNQTQEKLETVKNFDENRVLLHMPDHPTATPQEKKAALNAYKKRFPEIEYVEQMLTVPLYYQSAQNKNGLQAGPFQALTYAPYTAQHLTLPLRAGQWFTEAPKEEGVINCVLATADEFPVGELLTFCGVDESYHPNEPQLQFRVTGVIDRNGLIADFNGFSNDASLDVFIQKFASNGPKKPSPILLCAQEELSHVPRGRLAEYDNQNTLLVLREGTTPTAKERILAELGKDSWATTLEKAKENSREEAWAFLKVLLPIVAGLFLIGTVGLVGLSLLNAIKSMRVFTIYYISGMRWIDTIKICAGYIGCIFTGIIFLSGIAWAWASFSGILTSSHILLRPNNLLLTIVLLAITGAVSMLAPCFLLRKKSPVQLLREH